MLNFKACFLTFYIVRGVVSIVYLEVNLEVKKPKKPKNMVFRCLVSIICCKFAAFLQK